MLHSFGAKTDADHFTSVLGLSFPNNFYCGTPIPYCNSRIIKKPIASIMCGIMTVGKSSTLSFCLEFLFYAFTFVKLTLFALVLHKFCCHSLPLHNKYHRVGHHFHSSRLYHFLGIGIHRGCLHWHHIRCQILEQFLAMSKDVSCPSTAAAPLHYQRHTYHQAGDYTL